MKRVFFLFSFFLLIYGYGNDSSLSSLPPNIDSQPIPIKSYFSLLNLIKIDEKQSTFTANVYFTFEWKDPRLARKAGEPNTERIFSEEAAEHKLENIWWPQIEFINADSYKYNNRSLIIFADGTVRYDLGIQGCFYSELDFSRFPFDRQTLKIKVDSFIWDKSHMIFVPIKQEDYFSTGTQTKSLNDIEIVDINVTVEDTMFSLFENSNPYSTYIVSIVTERDPFFYVCQLIMPLIIIVAMTFSVFFYDKKGDLLARVSISLTGFLTFLAVRFALDQNIPRIDYMTTIDKICLVGYIVMGISVIFHVIFNCYYKEKDNSAYRIYKHAAWICPALFASAVAIILFLNY